MTLATHEDDLLGLVDHQHHPADDPGVFRWCFHCGIAAWWTEGARNAKLVSIIIAQGCVEQLQPACPEPLTNDITCPFT